MTQQLRLDRNTATRPAVDVPPSASLGYALNAWKPTFDPSEMPVRNKRHKRLMASAHPGTARL